MDPRTRRGVHTFLLVFAITGIAHLELYPFSGFRLFSEVRGEEHTSWELRAVDGDGQEIAIDVDRLPLGYRQAKRLIPTLSDLSERERDAICDAWAEPLRDSGVEVVRVRIYRTVVDVRTDGPPAQPTVQHECGGQAR